MKQIFLLRFVLGQFCLNCVALRLFVGTILVGFVFGGAVFVLYCFFVWCSETLRGESLVPDTTDAISARTSNACKRHSLYCFISFNFVQFCSSMIAFVVTAFVVFAWQI